MAPKKSIKKTVTKKTVKNAARPTVRRAEKTITENVAPMHECHCGCNCCCRGSKFIGLCVKLIVLCMVFFLGVISAPWVMGKTHHSMMKHIKFDDNGCVVMESVKCPKMLEELANADVDNNGCVSRMEMKHMFGKQHGPHMPKMDDAPMRPRPEM